MANLMTKTAVALVAATFALPLLIELVGCATPTTEVRTMKSGDYDIDVVVPTGGPCIIFDTPRPAICGAGETALITPMIVALCQRHNPDRITVYEPGGDIYTLFGINCTTLMRGDR